MLPLLRPLALLALLGTAGCAVAPDAAARKAREDAEPYVTLPPDTGSLLPRRVKASELGTTAARAPTSPVGGVGGETMRATNATVGDALGIPHGPQPSPGSP